MGEASAVGRRATYGAMALLCAMNLLNYVDRFVLPAIVSSVRRDIPMDDAAQGVALTAFIWVYMLASPVFGRLGDTRSRKHLLAFGVGLWSLATAAAAFVHTYAGLVAARAAVGVGEAAYASIAPALIGDYFPKAQRGRAMAVFYLATPVGSALGYILGGTVEHAAGWRAAFVAVGLPGLVLALLALFMVEPPRAQFDDGPHTTPALGDVLRSLRGNCEYRYAVAGTVAYTFAVGGLAQWMPTYLIRVRSVPSEVANDVFGIVTVVTGIVATLGGAWIADRLRGRVRNANLLVSGIATLVGVPFAVLAFTLHGVRDAWVAIALGELCFFACTGPANTVVADCVPGSMRTMAFAVSILATHMLGDAISPAIIGAVSDRSSLQSAVLLVPLFFGLAGVVWIFASRVLRERAS